MEIEVLVRKKIVNMDDQLLGKCGFYCGSCPTFLQDDCQGCLNQKQGTCFTRDCVINQKLNFCGECQSFPCHTILEKPNVSILSREWLKWKKNSSQ